MGMNSDEAKTGTDGESSSQQEAPTPRDYRRAGIFIVLAGFIQALIAYAFYEVRDQGYLNAALLFLAIAGVDLIVGLTVLAFSNRGGRPTWRQDSG